MDTEQILTDLRAERDRIEQAIAALERLDSTSTPKPGRPKGGTTFEFEANKTGRGRHISAAGRARIAAAAKARWARVKAAKPAKAGRRMSAAGRRRIAEAAKKMWARRKKEAAATSKPSASKKAAPARRMSAATRKRLSLLAKARWAARKKGKTA